MSDIIELVTRETVVIDTPTGSELLIIDTAVECEVVEVAEQGPQGPPGSPLSGISADANNAIRHGNDGGVWVADEMSIDPVLLFDNALT